MEIESLNENMIKAKTSKVDPNGLLKELNLFEGRIYTLIENMRTTLLNANVFNFKEYHCELNNLFVEHKYSLFKLEQKE